MSKYYTPSEKQEYQKSILQEAEQRIVELAETWRINPQDLSEYLAFQAKFHRYSARNTMLMYRQNPHVTFAASFRAYKEMGYHVKKGEHGMRILAPAPSEYFRTKEDGAWHPVKSASPEQKAMIKAGMLETRKQMHYINGAVFDISQTTCPREDYPKLLGLGYNDQQHAAIYGVICNYCESVGLPVAETDMKSAALHGQYFPSTKEIRINEMLGDTQKLSTILHELAHGLLDHDVNSEKSIAQKEFEADSLSIMLEDNFGIPVTEACKNHLASNYALYCDEQKAVIKPADTPALFAPIKQVYEQHREAIQLALESAGIQPIQEHEQAAEIAPEAELETEFENDFEIEMV